MTYLMTVPDCWIKRLKVKTNTMQNYKGRQELLMTPLSTHNNHKHREATITSQRKPADSKVSMNNSYCKIQTV